MIDEERIESIEDRLTELYKKSIKTQIDFLEKQKMQADSRLDSIARIGR